METIAYTSFIDASINHGIISVCAYNTVDSSEEHRIFFRNAANALNYAFILKKRTGLIIAKRAMELLKFEKARTGAISNAARRRMEAAQNAAAAPEAPQPEKVDPVITEEIEDSAKKIMSQWEEMKKKHPDALLLMRAGDFYELFGEDAVEASEILGITLTRRMRRKKPVELAGFPHHALDTYLPKLVRAGKRVAICEPLKK